MKKTLAILLAATGMAMGATPLELNWNDNEANLTKDANNNDISYDNGPLSNSISVAVTLNWDAMMNAAKTNGTSIFEIGMSNNTNQGLCVYSGGSKYIDAWLNNADFPDYYSEDTGISIKYSSLTDVSTAALVFTSYHGSKSVTTYFDATLYLWDKYGNLITTMKNDDGIESYSNSLNGASIQNIAFNQNFVENIAVYNQYIYGDEALAAATAVTFPSAPTPGDGNIPEPTTATLSLLALAGLAARRRRR